MRYAVTAMSEDGLSGEGPFFFTADSPEGARQQYIDWAYTHHGPAFAGPGFATAEPLSKITVEPATA